MDFEKRLEQVAKEIAKTLCPEQVDTGTKFVAKVLDPLRREFWNEAIEAAKAVCEREGYDPDRTITDPQFAWLSACVVCGLEIDDLKEVAAEGEEDDGLDYGEDDRDPDEDDGPLRDDSGSPIYFGDD